MYSFANRPDTKVIDEPYYAYYLNLTGKPHPGFDEIIESQNTNIKEAFNELVNIENTAYKNLFIKNMAKHFIDLDYNFIEPFTNVILIRNPYQLIASYASIVPNPSMEDIGAKRQFNIYKELEKNNREIIVLDSGEVLKDPEKVLKSLCQKLQIPFLPEMIRWPKGPRKEDGIWAKYWYKNVHNSTGFQKQKSSERELGESLMELYSESKEYYDILFNHAIKA